jgi:hypothetical protein
MSLGARLRSEAGVAIPTVLVLLIVGLGLGSAAVTATVSSQHGTIRDSKVKGALAAADAGRDQAIYRENKILTTTSARCVLEQPTALVAGAVGADGWCPAVNGSVGSATFSYRVKPWCLTQTPTCNPTAAAVGRQITVVSTGTQGGVSRRIAETAFSPIGTSIFGNESALGRDGVSLAGSSTFGSAGPPVVKTNVGTNGSITAAGSSQLCGDARHGPGGTITPGHQVCGGAVTTGTLDMPPPDQSLAKADSATSRFFTLDPKVGSVTWNQSTRTLDLKSNSTLTIGGDNYSLCRLTMGGGALLIMAAGAHSKFFFDTPENCGLSNGALQVDVNGGSAILSSSLNSGSPAADLPGFYLVGSNTITTGVSISGSGQENLILYGPRTDVTLWGNGSSTTFSGQFAGKTLSIGGNARIVNSGAVPNSNIPTLLLYNRQRYVECTGATGTPPDADC